MNYLLLKALHIIAIVIWVGGMLVAGITVSAAANEKARLPSAFITAVRRWDRRVTSPAMLAAWALGLSLAYAGSWFQQGWFGAKAFLVLILSALHGMVSGRLSRLAADKDIKAGPGIYAPTLVIVIVSLIVVLVTTKPF
jgi:uncharacterized membrane protein